MSSEERSLPSVEEAAAEAPAVAPAVAVRRVRHVWFYRGLGIVAVGLATAGVVLPLLPTTPFLLVALWAFARGAPEWAERLRRHRTFGPTILAWETRGAIPVRAKAAAILLMTASWVGIAVVRPNVILLSLLAVTFVAVSTFILTRPSS